MSQILVPTLAVLLPAFVCPPQSDSAPQTTVNVPALVETGLNYLTSVAAPVEGAGQKSKNADGIKSGVSEPDGTIITVNPAQKPLVIHAPRASQPLTFKRMQLVRDPSGQFVVIQA